MTYLKHRACGIFSSVFIILYVYGKAALTMPLTLHFAIVRFRLYSTE